MKFETGTPTVRAGILLSGRAIPSRISNLIFRRIPTVYEMERVERIERNEEDRFPGDPKEAERRIRVVDLDLARTSKRNSVLSPFRGEKPISSEPSEGLPKVDPREGVRLGASSAGRSRVCGVSCLLPRGRGNRKMGESRKSDSSVKQQDGLLISSSL